MKKILIAVLLFAPLAIAQTTETHSAFLETLFDPAFLSQSDYQTLFNLGFYLPLLAYITAWSFQTVINFASKDKE